MAMMHFTLRVDGAAFEVTPWLSADVPPRHPGVYQRNDPAGPYSCWDGSVWHGDAPTPAEAVAQAAPSPHQGASWRGLAAPPSEPCATCGGEGVVETHDEDSGEYVPGDCPDC